MKENEKPLNNLTISCFLQNFLNTHLYDGVNKLSPRSFDSLTSRQTLCYSRREMTSAPPTPTEAAIDSIQRSLSELCVTDEHQRRFYFDNPRRFCSFASRLQVILQQLLRSSPSPESLPAAALTALKGIAADLTQAADTASLYLKRSKIFVLVNCRSLCDTLQERTLAIAAWLALLDSAIHDLPDLRKKISDLSRDMKQVQFIVILSLSLSLRICFCLL